ncbi:hypothetical protein CPAR01_14069 [Colletotrichum paranaense]|uniref:Uncharacterized protein n=6 Tax=Colletotrichum acutatum species complex TaxID=2707335 RepID=A0A9Q8SK40_9PEZI|nr:uncharacterized protein CLUP02_03848 [Colletotrichum lupini]XP_060304700.1 uncharacterized protein CCOS01_16676 [Colletotrichum costaricense]XP_060343055.1 uncharacterized protein CPAR01_14069 [Colletotrichum paranaense]XP_060383611.1 uncharacterized protein CTAM01_05912 [Colletotrichum tamarilloi]KAI3536879.1 hypothetical protein CSPX01_10579 [Colletotrichum filicis]KAK0378177.1 hypothetical protein CLIM01_04483 [Colletotrichum limetticola]KAK1462601.1 hypothetical protein CMEL01_13712 [C
MSLARAGCHQICEPVSAAASPESMTERPLSLSSYSCHTISSFHLFNFNCSPIALH